MTSKQTTSDDSSGRDSGRPQTPIATTAITQNYGTMSQSKKATPAGENETSASQPPSGAPPRAAVRKKIHQKPLERLTMVEDHQTEEATAQRGKVSKKLDSPLNQNVDPVTERALEHQATNISDQLALRLAEDQPEENNNNSNSNLFKSDATKSGQASPRKYPKKVLFIVANEFCERFSYYGLRTVLVLYFRSVLGFSDSGSTVSFHLFTMLCYLTPVLGAILGDSILGKYKTILYLSIVYFFGELLLVLSSVWWDFGWASVALTWAALLMIGVGTGGIKPCVSAFGGDQFEAHETKWRESFFSLFYGAINLGSLISMFLTPMLRAKHQCVGRSDCYPLAFLVPCILMFVAIVVFLAAHNYYYVAPLPKRNMILAFCQCTWLALKRKLAGYKLAPAALDGSNTLLDSYAHEANSTSSNSSLSMVSSNATTAGANSGAETETTPVVGHKQLSVAIMDQSKSRTEPLDQAPEGIIPVPSTSLKRRNHWLYLASDRFDANSIEEFRCILAIFFLFLPTPMFWALFDQQGSLWTLQATRMDGHIWNSSFVLEPDQMMVFNPLLLLASIPLFQLVIYPAFNSCNLLTTPIQKMTTGGFLAALTFVLSALIEFQIQASSPAYSVLPSQASLLLVNGIADCSLVEPKLTGLNETILVREALHPLGAQRVALTVRGSAHESMAAPQSHKLTFKLGAPNQTSPISPHAQFVTLSAPQPSTNSSTLSTVVAGCPFDVRQHNEIHIGPLADQSIHMLYIEQGNGRLNHKLFNESLVMPGAGKARVRLLYESFGSYSQAMKRQFYLSKDSSTKRESSRPRPELQFNMTTRDGQVLLSGHIDVEVASAGQNFTLNLNETDTKLTMQHPTKIFLKPGTLNLIILHQKDAKSYELHQELLQDNNYRISVLYQLAPYLLISFSEVLFSITGLEFSYSMAPPNMKSLILGAWCLTTAVGNLLTVAVESIHFFDNIGYDFLLYAALMALDIFVFAIIGYNYEPYEPALKSSSSIKQQQRRLEQKVK